jgi:hypothetical protein
LQPKSGLKPWIGLEFSGLPMTRLLSIAVLASLLGLAAAGGAVGGDLQVPQALPMSQSGADPGGPMPGTGCGACAAGCACTSANGLQAPETQMSWPPVVRPSSQLSDPIRAPETAPPKRSVL